MRTLFVNVGISLLLIFNSNSFLIAQETTIIPVSSQPRLPTAQSVNKMRTEAKQLLKLGDEKYNNDNELSLYIRTEEAIEYWEKAARIYRETQDFRLEAEVLERLGSAYKLLYQRAKDQLLVGVEDHGNKATSFYRQAFTKYEKIGDFPNQARILRLMGDIYVGLSEYIKASESYDQASNIFATLNDYENEAAALTSLGFAYSILLKYEMATDAYQRALIRFKQIKNYHGEAHVSNDLARVYIRHLSQYGKAISLLRQGLLASREINDRQTEATTLLNLGDAYRLAHKHEDAIVSYQSSIEIYEDFLSGDLQPLLRFNYGYFIALNRNKQNALIFLGNLFITIGDYEKALETHEKALLLADKVKDQDTKARILSYLGQAHRYLGQYAKSIELQELSLAIFKDSKDYEGKICTLIQLGDTHSRLFQNEKAIELYKQALHIARKNNAFREEAKLMQSIAGIYMNLLSRNESFYSNEAFYSQALKLYYIALDIAQKNRDYDEEMTIQTNLGRAYIVGREYPKAIQLYQNTLKFYRQTGVANDEIHILASLGAAYYLVNDYEKSFSFYMQSLGPIYTRQDRRRIGLLYSNMGNLFRGKNCLDIAIAFYKKSVNTYEEIRTGNRQLTPEQQASYTETIRKTYESLAALLFQEKRIAEALQVLDLLKVQDLQDFLKDRNPNPNETSTLKLLDPETAILQDFEQQKPRSLNQWLTSPTLQRHIQTIKTTAIDEGYKSKGYQNLQTRLNQLSPTAALFYPLILPDRLELVILTPGKAPIHKTVKNLPKAQLEQTIDRFSQQISDPYPNGTNSLDQTKQTAQTLYKWLIEPIAQDLKAANITTLLYAPDGKLRYIPLAALHDGQNWLIQTYTINHLTAFSLTPTTQATTSAPKALVGAITQPSTVQVAGQRHTFDGLSNTAIEATAIGNLFTTKPLIDKDLSLPSITANLPSANIIHLASHAQFNPQSPNLSFILLGNNQTLTLRDLKDLKLPNINLFVLSACETAQGVSKDGIELFGFGYQLQRNQVRATIASLWKVNDPSTSQLMQSFYQNLNTRKISTAEALQRAQREALKDPTWNQLPNGQTLRSSTCIGFCPNPYDQPQRTIDPRHPYYWAPFILIGNGL